MLRQAIVLVIVYSILQLGWQALAQVGLTGPVVQWLVVRPAAWEVNLLTPTVQAQAAGIQLRAAGGSLNVINGCDGTDLLFLLVAGFCVAPLTGRGRLGGALLGMGVVHVLNQARLLALFYAARNSPAWFDALHGMVAPLAVMALLATYYFLALQWLPGRPPRLRPA